jgi:hypothetical protein
MREIDREYSIKKKLVNKTTLLTTLLVAATLILSSAVTATTMNVNDGDETGQNQPLILGDADDSAVEPPEPELAMELDDERPYAGSYRSIILWDNGMSYVGMASAQDDQAYPFLSELADDFHFDEDTEVVDVHWVGGYWNGVTAPFDWRIRFYEDAGNVPGALFAGPFEFTWDEISKISLGSEYWECSVFLPEVVTFTGCEKYWVSIQGVGIFPPQSGWAYHIGGPLMEGFFKSAFFGYPDWTSSYTVWGDHYGFCFQLTGAVQHDVGPTKIKYPESGLPECGCLPVEVAVKNFGLNDETGVWVNVEIRHYQWFESFEDQPYWDLFGDYCCNFGLVGLETSYPFYVTPRSGMQMLELQQSGCPYGWAYAMTMFPTDFSCKCNPRFSFYMWHDEYGSDDYLNVWMDAGSGWVQIAGPIYRNDCEPGCPPGWKEHIVDLSAYAHDPDPVWFLFEGHCDMPESGYNLHIDDVACYDLEYAECQQIDIESQEEKQVEFPCWTPCKWQVIKNEYWDYEVIVETKLDETCEDPKDQVPENNKMVKMITIYFPCFHDVGGYAIYKPACNEVYKAQEFEMQGSIKNFGQFEECCFPVWMQVHPLDVDNPTLLFFEDFDGPEDYPFWPPTSNCGQWDDSLDPTNNWRYDYSGVCPYVYPYQHELQFYWIPYGFIADSLVFTCAIDTSGYGAVIIEFEHYLSHFSGPYTLSVETSSDGVNWDVVESWENPTGFPCTEVHIQTGLNVGGPFYVGFRFSGGDPWNLNYWNINDVAVYGLEMLPAVYEEEYCVEEIDICEEIIIDFPPWTPEPPYPCFCGTVKYMICIKTKMCTWDQTPENDMYCCLIEVEFLHDVGLKKFTKPAEFPAVAPGDLLWSFDAEGATGDFQCLGVEMDNNDNVWVTGGNSGGEPNQLYKLAVDGTLLNTYAQASNPGWGWRDLAFDGTYLHASDSTSIQEIDPATGAATGNTIPGPISPCRALAYDPAADTFWTASFGSDYFEIDRSGGIVNQYPNPWSAAYGMAFGDLCDGYLWVHDQGGSGTDIHQVDPETGLHTGLTYNYLQGIAGGLALHDMGGVGQLVGLTQGTPDEVFALELCQTSFVPEPDVYIACGEADICVIAENLGTSVEDCTICYELYWFNEEDLILELVGDGCVEDILIDPCGTQQEECIGSYDFTPCGIYFLIAWIESEHPECEGKDGNNVIEVIIGVDCCPPESCHVLDPVDPDGENNWYSDPVEVTLYGWEPCTCCTVHSGIDYIVYIVNGVEDQIDGAEGTFTISEDGVHHVVYYAVDMVGHVEEEVHSFEVAIDSTPPTVEIIFKSFLDEADQWNVELTALAADETSGMNRVEWKINTELKETDEGAGPYVYTVLWDEELKTKTFYAHAFDDAGNTAYASLAGGDIPIIRGKTQSMTQSREVTIKGHTIKLV